MNKNTLQYAEFVDLLTDGPTGERRCWAATLVLRALETRGGSRYRRADRLSDVADAQAAIASLRTAMSVLSKPEQGLLLRMILVVPWEHLRRDTGLTLRLPEILAMLSKELGISRCLAAVQSVLEQGDDAVRRYPLDGLLPEVRRPGEGLVVNFDARERQRLGISVQRIEIDRLTTAVHRVRGLGSEANLRPLVSWWLAALERGEADGAVRTVLSDLKAAARDDRARWRSLGLLDWMAAHPDHPRADQALVDGRDFAHADVRKAAADLAAALARWDVLEALARDDPDKGVRQRAEKLLTSKERLRRTKRPE